MNQPTPPSAESLAGVDPELLRDLLLRVKDIDNSYKAVALKMGQLYMRADENDIASLTKRLDKPMRNASENEQMFAAILESIQMQVNQNVK